MTDRDDLYQAWAPLASPWATWAKPVLFAHVPWSGTVDDPAAAADLSALPASDGATAVVADLPGAIGVATAVMFARLGYRPVPLYNAVPAPAGVPSALDVGPIVAARVATADDLRDASLSDDAPPAFLLDGNRRVARVSVGPGVFDNRSISLPTDFPSADRLRVAGVRRVILVQAAAVAPRADLAHTLRRWQEGGLPILRYASDIAGQQPTPIMVARPGGFRSMWHALWATVGLRRYPLGGFGGTLPVPSAG